MEFFCSNKAKLLGLLETDSRTAKCKNVESESSQNNSHFDTKKNQGAMNEETRFKKKHTFEECSKIQSKRGLHCPSEETLNLN